MKLKFLSMALIAMMAVSCGGGSKDSYTVTAEDPTVGGSLGEYVTLKTGDYTMQCKDNYVSMTVTFEVKAIPAGKEAPYYPETKLILLDENKSPLGIEIEDLRKQEWNMEAVTNKFKELQFNRFIERFNLNGLGTAKKETKLEDLFKVKELNIEDKKEISEEIKSIEEKNKFIYYFEKVEAEGYENKIIKLEIKSICFVGKDDNTIVYLPFDISRIEEYRE